AFGVERVNGSSLDGRDGLLDKTALVQRVRVDENLYIHFIGDREATIDRCRRRTPVFVQLQPAHAALDLLNETRRQAGAALAKTAHIHRESVGRLEHPLNMPRPRRAGRGRGPRRRTRAPTHHRRNPGVERLLYLLRADEMNVNVDPTRGNDLALA